MYVCVRAFRSFVEMVASVSTSRLLNMYIVRPGMAWSVGRHGMKAIIDMAWSVGGCDDAAVSPWSV